MDRPTLVHSIEVSAPPAVVWRAITDPTYVEQYFFGLSPRGAWQAGARILFETRAGQVHITADVLEIDEKRRLRFSVRLLRDLGTAADLPSRVTWEIEPTRDGSRVTVVHDEFDGETATFRRMGGGWPTALAGLQELIETGRASAAQSTWPEDIERPPTH